jgi:hypothetical protein
MRNALRFEFIFASLEKCFLSDFIISSSSSMLHSIKMFIHSFSTFHSKRKTKLYFAGERMPPAGSYT